MELKGGEGGKPAEIGGERGEGDELLLFLHFAMEVARPSSASSGK